MLFYFNFVCGHIGPPKQWNGGHVGVPDQSRGSWTLFLCKYFLLFQLICIDAGHVSKTLYILNESTFVIRFCSIWLNVGIRSLRSKRFRLVSQQRKKRDSRFWPREKWNEPKNETLTPFFARSLTLVPRSLLLNRTETLARQARE